MYNLSMSLYSLHVLYANFLITPFDLIECLPYLLLSYVHFDGNFYLGFLLSVINILCLLSVTKFFLAHLYFYLLIFILMYLIFIHILVFIKNDISRG